MHHGELLRIGKKSFALRRKILGMIHKAGSGHTGGALSVVDILNVLYDKFLKFDANNPWWEERDRFILSAGHVCPALYAVLADNGFFDPSLLDTLRKAGSPVLGHPERRCLPGIENTSGPLGQGYVLAVGMALAAKMQKKDHKVYCLASDGEHDEGAVWEAMQLASFHKLNNLCVIVDRNHVQIDGSTDETLALRSLHQKYRSFGWKVIDIDGHNIRLIHDALMYFKHHHLNQPFCIIAHTTLGKGVSFMANNPSWHGKAPDDVDLEAALQELDRKERSFELFHGLKRKRVLR